jgi:hypothetical protein
LAASFANIFAFRAVGEVSWLIAAGCSAFTILFTGAFMKRDIERIAMESDPKEIESSVNSFTMKHHVRSVLAISAFTIGILKSGGFAKQSSLK